jgi:C1A family cysteine protease
VVTPVYNQGQCGSCWAFSATENIESQWALAGNQLTELSMQQIVDCSDWDDGCSGGWPSYAYDYVIDAPGQDPLASYPYTAEDGTCAYNASAVVAKISSWAYTTTDEDEHQMANYLALHGPISVCVDAEEWDSYTGGLFLASSCGTSLDHCVLAVGYNLAANPPYWIIRNSWGTDWGIKGYMYLEFGQDACGVATETTSAII